MVSIFLALIFGLALLFHFARMGVGLNTQLLNVADIHVHCSILMAHFALGDLPTQCKHTKAFFSSKVLFLLRAVRTASESTEKCVQSTEISVQFGPVRTQRTFFEKAHLFLRVRPSISQSYFSSALAPKDQGHRCAQTRVSSAEVSRCAHICPGSLL